LVSVPSPVGASGRPSPFAFVRWSPEQQRDRRGARCQSVLLHVRDRAGDV